MLVSSQEFKDIVYAEVREFKGRATISMDAFSQVDPRPLDLTTDYVGKVATSVIENSNIAKSIGTSLTRTPSYTGWTELAQASYDAMNIEDTTSFKVSTTAGGTKACLLLSFNVIDVLERQFGKYMWGSAVTLADKIAVAKGMISQMTLTANGYAVSPTRQTFTSGIRYIRDYLNGNTVNAYNYWNDIQAWSGTINRASGKAPTISSSTLTNPTNITDGSASTYGYESSGNGVAKYVQIDLGEIFYDINAVKIFHYYADGRTFHGTKTQVSADGTTWKTLYDSAVSGEYVETSTGKVYSGDSTYSSAFNMTVYDATDGIYGSYTSHSNPTFQELTRVTTLANLVIDSAGFTHFMINSNSTDGSSEAAIYIDYCKLFIEGSFTNIRIYDDDTIMSMDIVEQMSILNDTLPSNQLTLTLHNDSGELDLLTFSNMQQVIASKPTIMTEIGLVISDTVVEWIPTGFFFLTDWKNDVMNKIITLNCNDYFFSLTDISYTPTTSTNLATLAAEVLTRGGVPTNKQIIDSALNAITVNKFPDRIDCRTALQHIGVAGRVAVFQDREGNVVLKTFQSIDEVTNYISYPTTQNQLMGYPGPNSYAENSTGGGMKYIDFDQQYNVPEVSLEKSVYQVVINNYADPANPVEILYTNAVIEGLVGDSFTIDNPLINNSAIADKVADWYIRELNYNAIYTCTWRQNPILECADMILVEDSFGAEKQSRIIQQELRYQGFLDGITTSRGGV